MKKSRKVISIRLTPETLNDIESLRIIRGYSTTSDIVRYLLHIGFSNLGNWRKGLPPIRPLKAFYE